MPAIPDRPLGCDLYEQCFNDLSGDRQLTDRQIGPIPYLAIMQWCRDQGLGADQAQHVRRVVQKVDSEMRKKWSSKPETKAKDHGPSRQPRKFGRPY